jgi:pyridoxamine 5'-phosphate oxidase
MDLSHPPSDPVASCQQWFQEASSAEASPNPLAMGLSTVDATGRPSSRMVLLKGFDADGAVFYTNLNSAKAKAIEANPVVALLFHWDAQERQIRIVGRATPVTGDEADAYFASRPRGSQIAAIASSQSSPLESRQELADAAAAVADQFKDEDAIPRPSNWSGFRVALESVEFWQGGGDRLHHRILYEFNDGTWSWTYRWP